MEALLDIVKVEVKPQSRPKWAAFFVAQQKNLHRK